MRLFSRKQEMNLQLEVAKVFQTMRSHRGCVIGISDLLATTASISFSQGHSSNNALRNISSPTASTLCKVVFVSYKIGASG